MSREKLLGIYQIDSKVHPERFYIGSSHDLIIRWKCHLGRLKKGKHHSKILQHHYDKYGKEDLSFSILFYCQRDDLLKYEQILLDFFNPYLNVFKTAGSAKGMVYGQETRMSIAAFEREERKRLNKKK
jgi:group I intron endonuclease